MAASLRTELVARITGTQVGANDFGGPRFQPTIENVLQTTYGVAANQADILFTDNRTLAASATEDLDLAGVLTDAFGATITMAEVVAVLVIADPTNVNSVVIGDATAPVPLFGGTNATIAVKPGGHFFAAAPNAAGLFTVGAGTTDDLKIANSSSGTSVVYEIAIVGRSA